MPTESLSGENILNVGGIGGVSEASMTHGKGEATEKN